MCGFFLQVKYATSLLASLAGDKEITYCKNIIKIDTSSKKNATSSLEQGWPSLGPVAINHLQEKRKQRSAHIQKFSENFKNQP